ncbi:antiterminator LoaP [Paenibacillus tarimensis]|uniref:antiterminator LoaP n=1 Tax=Paenibacillus tarimensis TaxID=416012 RepID=UPI001F1F33B9|nr:antiterminator LoaP [Paenibacillus tarimensis]MCF2943973.1 antiterminator LoaP [Paenibacillus tarimensis]
MNWYALYVETGKEEAVQKFLRLSFNEQMLYSLVPQRKIPEKKSGRIYHVYKKLFPGYVLIRTNMNPDFYYRLRDVPHLLWLVNTGPHYSQNRGLYFSPIAEAEITPILDLLNEENTVHYSQVFLGLDSKATIISGPLRGKEGIIKKLDKRKNRAKILLHFLEKEVLMDVGIEILNPMEHRVEIAASKTVTFNAPEAVQLYTASSDQLEAAALGPLSRFRYGQ